MKSVQEYLKEHPRLATAVRWGVPITVGLGTAAVIAYCIYTPEDEKKAALDQCTKEALDATSDVMKNCLNYVSDYVCDTVNSVSVCGKEWHNITYSCKITSSTYIEVTCVSTDSLIKEELIRNERSNYIGGPLLGVVFGAFVGAAEGFIQRRVLEPKTTNQAPSNVNTMPTSIVVSSDESKINMVPLDDSQKEQTVNA